MRELQDVLERKLSSLPEDALAELIARKCSKKGVELSDQERMRLARVLLNGQDHATVNSDKEDLPDITVELDSEDLEDLEERLDKFVKDKLPEVISQIIEDLAPSILMDLKKRWRAEARAQRKDLDAFNKRLRQTWSAPLGGLRMLLTISRELGESIGSEAGADASDDGRTYLVEVLIRLHARSCHIGEELLTLLECGFADGAMARWRSLHEVAVVASLVASHGEDLAERYFAYQAVEAKRAMSAYQECQHGLGYEPLEQNEIDTVERAYNDALSKYGTQFGKGEYGWAAHHLGNAKPNFAEIEKAVGIGHMRAYYRMASHNVHANPKGVYFKLGLLDESQVLLSGPSNIGLADPGNCAALSLTQIAEELVPLATTVDHWMAVEVMRRLVDEVGEAFMKVHEEIASSSDNE